MGLRNAPEPGSVSPALFHSENQFSRDKSSTVHTTESLKQSLGNRRGGGRKNTVTAVVSLNHSTQAGRTRMCRKSKSDPPRNRHFALTPVEERSEQHVLREQRRRLQYFANSTVIGEAELSHQSTEQQAFCGQRRKAPYFANRTVIGGAELSHHSTEQQALCEQRRMLPYFANRTVIGGAELSHHITEQEACVWCGALTPQHRAAGFV